MMVLKCGFRISFLFSITDLIKHVERRYDIIAYWLLVLCAGNTVKFSDVFHILIVSCNKTSCTQHLNSLTFQCKRCSSVFTFWQHLNMKLSVLLSLWRNNNEYPITKGICIPNIHPLNSVLISGPQGFVQWKEGATKCPPLKHERDTVAQTSCKTYTNIHFWKDEVDV